MKDSDIRHTVLAALGSKYKSDLDTVIIEELGLCQGDGRVDIAVVNGAIHGFEIKSNEDTLRRLPGQIEIYSRTLETVTLVVGNKHLEQALKVIPKWWGVVVAKEKSGQSHLRTKRKCKSNPCLDPFAVVQLLWRNEAFEALRERGLHGGLISKPRGVLWNRLVECLPLDELMALIRNIIKSRVNWRSDCIQA